MAEARLRRGAAVLAAALLAAGCEGAAEREPRAPDAAPAAAVPKGERPDGERTGGRRGDRHARAAARRSPRVKRVEGTLTSAARGRVVIRAPGAAPLTLRVAPSTAVTVGGRPAAIEALRAGAEVRASYRSGGGRPMAIGIEVRGAPARREAEPREADPSAAPPSGG
jgi:hypothetical protein